MSQMDVEDCLFCRMERGAVDVPRVAENEFAFAIRDIHPRAPVHVLIIPRRHIPTAAHVRADDGPVLAGMFVLSQEVARIEHVAESGYRLALNVGEAAGMTIFHVHMHLLGARRLGPEG